MKNLFILIFSLSAILFSNISNAQQRSIYPGFNDEINERIKIDSTSKLLVSSIIIDGNKRTKNYIILREMQIKTGDSILASSLFEKLTYSRALVYNTNLFSEVEVVPVMISAYELIIKITLLEKLYFLPAPQFKLIDRNLNEWYKTYNADLNRVVYGAKIDHYNLSGRGDKLRIYLLNGYFREASFSYSSPYSNMALTEGFSISGGYSQTREFPYKTSYNNSLLQFKTPGFSKNNFFASIGYQKRRGFFQRHIFSISYNRISVNDSAIFPQYNPYYFNLNKSTVSFPDLKYSFQYTNTNNNNYPLSGKIFTASILKRGTGFTGGINMLSVDATVARFIPHSGGFYSSFQFLLNIKAPFTQAYINQGALGYKEFNLRGLEYYVIDGVISSLAKYTLRKKLVEFDIPFPFKIKKIPKIPIAVYAKAYADLGYSYNKQQFDTRLGNRMLYTTGFGFDILSIYDSTLRLEYSFNQLGENGLFLHAKSGF